jgi:uncharacterized protein YbjT (DUF2867 family)
LARGKKVRAIVRDARKAEPLRAAGAELQVVDGHDVPRVAQALRDVEGAYVMLPPRVDSEDLLLALAAYTDAMARALREVRVPHVVLLSSIGSQLPAGTGPIASTHYAEQALRAESSALSILRPPYFMDNWAGSLTRLAENKLASMFALDLAIPMIASEDIGRLAAALPKLYPACQAFLGGVFASDPAATWVPKLKTIVASFENWWDKYRVTLTEIESKRDAAAQALQGFLKGLRYV